MNKQLKKYLEKFSKENYLLNSLIVTLFTEVNNFKGVKNELIKSLQIPESDDSYQHIANLRKLLNNNNNLSFDDLIELFESIIPEDEKVTNGAVYTPNYIKNYIVESIFSEKKFDKKVAKGCDLSCGCGGFLFTIAEHIHKNTNKNFNNIFRENLYGLDISQNSIDRTKILLSLFAISHGEDRKKFTFNLFCGNALNFNWHKKITDKSLVNGFDYIVGNPPYVRTKNIDEENKELLDNWIVTKSGNPDLYIPFFEIGMKFLSKNGTLGYITVNSFFRSVNARELRKFFQTNSFHIRIIDFKDAQLFVNKSTYTCICFIKHQKSDEIYYAKSNSKKIQDPEKENFNNIKYETLDHHNGWLLSEDKTIENIKNIEESGTQLGKLYEIRNGLATLRNSIYIFKPKGEDEKYFQLKTKQKEYLIEKSICKDIIKPNILKNENELHEVMGKIIFPYFINGKNIKLFKENYFKQNFPKAYEYLYNYREELAKRDKGKREYEAWYAFGRNQALTNTGYKLLFPYIADRPIFVYTDYYELLLYCGYAIFSENKEDLLILKKILNSKIFWYYIKNTAKPYAGGYFALAKNYVKNFPICELNREEKELILNSQNDTEITNLLYQKYNIEAPLN